MKQRASNYIQQCTETQYYGKCSAKMLSVRRHSRQSYAENPKSHYSPLTHNLTTAYSRHSISPPKCLLCGLPLTVLDGQFAAVKL